MSSQHRRSRLCRNGRLRNGRQRYRWRRLFKQFPERFNVRSKPWSPPRTISSNNFHQICSNKRIIKEKQERQIGTYGFATTIGASSSSGVSGSCSGCNDAGLLSRSLSILKPPSLAVARKYDTRRIGLSSSSIVCAGFGRNLTGSAVVVICHRQHINAFYVKVMSPEELSKEQGRKKGRKIDVSHRFVQLL